MENSKIKDILKKENMESALKFVKDHRRYFAAGALFLILVLVLANCTDPADNKPDSGIVSEDDTEEFEIDSHEEINALITQYYAAYAAGDIATLQTLATPISANEQSYIRVFSQYVDEWRNIHCYTKRGLDASSYLVSVTMEIKFTEVDTPAPGLDFFYVRTNEAGALYIDNLYCHYNANNQEYAVDTSVQALIDDFELGYDVYELQNDVQERYNQALLSDPSLVAMVQTTIQNAIDEWGMMVAQNAAQGAQQDAGQDAQQDAGQDTPQDAQDSGGDTDTPEGNEPAGNQTTETLATTDRVNVRAGADTSAARLGTVSKGTVVTRVGIEGDWSIIEYNGGTGYIRNDFLTYDLPTNSNPQPSDNNAGDSISFAEGTEIRLKNTVNVRDGMSETADRIGTAYAGDTVTVIMSYADGWTKVNWKGKTGYIKSSLLQ